jgi:hypothetical protein
MEETLIRGTYYLGDPSYVLSEKLYYDVLGEKYKFESGKHDLTNNENYENYENFVVIHNTHNGDGIFKDTKQRKYKVETGLIGLVPKRLIPEEKMEQAKKCGHFFNFPSNIQFYYDAGIFYVKSANYYIKINTINEEEYESDHEEHYLVDNEKIQIIQADDNSSIEDLYSSDEEELEEIKQPNKPVFFNVTK